MKYRQMVLLAALLTPAVAGAQGHHTFQPAPNTQAKPSTFDAEAYRRAWPDQKRGICLLNRKTDRSECHTRKEWQRIASALKKPD